MGEYPYMVSIFNSTWFGIRLKCGGVLRDSQTVITSSSCVYGETAYGLTIKFGSLNRNEIPQSREVTSIRIHHLFDPDTTSSPFLYDVAILKLNNYIAETDSIKYIPPLPTTEPSSNENVSGTTMVSFAGWGKTNKDDKELPTMLQFTELPLLSQCNNTNTTTAIQRCMGGDGKGACVGDEGGPVIYNNQLVGILSQGSCGSPDGQNVYTSTIAVRDFLYS
ncbi:unnamed protein product [Cunninghamella echinulata]